MKQTSDASPLKAMGIINPEPYSPPTTRGLVGESRLHQAVTERTTIQHRMHNLGEEMAGLWGELQELENRLGPVLQPDLPDVPSPGEKNPVNDRYSLIEETDKSIQVINMMRSSVRSIIDRLYL